MPRSFLTEIRGFTPIIDVLVREVGLTQAAVYGVVWRYCQMSDGVCSASQETIAEHIGITRKAVNRAIVALKAAGYLEDVTPPGYRGATKIYRDTGRVKILGLVEARLDDNLEVGANDDTGANRHNEQTESAHTADNATDPVTVGYNPVTVGYNPVTVGYNPVTVGYTKRVFKDTIQDTSEETLTREARSLTRKTSDTPTLKPSTPEARILFAKLQRAANDAGRRGPQRFATAQQREQFEHAAAVLKQDLTSVIDRALARGITSLAGVIAYVAKAAQNIRNEQANCEQRTDVIHEATEQLGSRNSDTEFWKQICEHAGLIEQYNMHLCHCNAERRDGTLIVTPDGELRRWVLTRVWQKLERGASAMGITLALGGQDGNE